MEGEPVLRRHRPDGRRGSIKSRIVELSKRRKKEPPDKTRQEDKGGDRRDRTVTVSSGSGPAPEPTHLKPPVKRRYHTRAPVLILRDPQPSDDDVRPTTNGVNGIKKNEFDKITRGGEEAEGDTGRPIMSPPRPSELFISERRGENYDYSFMSSCSLPSENTSVSSPSPRQEPDSAVTLRNLRDRTRVLTSHNQSGRLLNSALARHFRRLHCGGGEVLSDPTTTALSDNLYQYLKDVFCQLDSQHTGTVSRQDFQALCQILNLDLEEPSPCSVRTGLQWLPSYLPRPATPGAPPSPIRPDRISEAELRSPNPGQQTNFLWTIGTRPFWELWPQRRHKKKQLSLTEFIQCLLEQWAATHRYPVELAAEIMLHKDQGLPAKVLFNNLKRFYISVLFDIVPQSLDTYNSNYSRLLKLSQSQVSFPDKSGRATASHVHYQDDSQFDRLRRAVRRLIRRNHKQERLGRTGTCLADSVHIPSRNGTNGTAHFNFPRRDNSIRSRFRRSSSRKLGELSETAARQKEEIQALKDCVHHLRGSIQLSDAQNLALQVLLKKMSKAETKLPLARTEKSEFRSHMRRSEQQLENLVSELKEMSRTKYPTISSNNYSSSLLSSNGISKQGVEDTVEDDLLGVHKSISGVTEDLTATRHHLHRISRALDPGSERKSNTSMAEAYEALLKTEQEIDVLRSSLSSTLTSLELAQKGFAYSQAELKEAKDSLSQTTRELIKSEKKIDRLDGNRKSLLQEIKATKDVLMSSLKNVKDLELESRKVPQLEARIEDLEKLLPFERPGKISKAPPDPTSLVLDDSFMIYSSDVTESEGETELLSVRPPRPPSCRSKDKSNVSASPELFSPTPSSGHFSGGSGSALSKSPQDTVVARLRREIDCLKTKMSDGERERLVAEDLKQERARLSIIEQKIKEILSVIKSLNSMNLSQRKLGSLVIAAVEEAYDTSKAEVDVYRFLSILYESSREQERRAADNMLSDALLAVTDYIEDSDSDSEDMNTIRPRQSSLYRIDV